MSVGGGGVVDVNMRVMDDAKHDCYVLPFIQLFGPHEYISTLCLGPDPFLKFQFFRISFRLSKNADFWAPPIEIC